MNKFLVTAVLAPFLLLATTLNSSYVLADTYNFEMELNGLKSDADMNEKRDIYGLSGTFYFISVDDSFGPVAEAAFLNKASFLSASFNDISVDSTSVDTDGDLQGLSGSAVLANRFIFQAGYIQQKIDSDIITDEDVYSVGLGFYIDDLTSLILEYQQTDLENISGTFNDVSLNLKSIVEIGDARWVTGRASIGISQRAGANTVINLGTEGDYYFSERFSFGVSLNLLEANSGAGSTTYGLGAKFFITPRLALAASFSKEVFLEEDTSSTTVITDVLNTSTSDTNDQGAKIDNTDIYQISITGRI